MDPDPDEPVSGGGYRGAHAAPRTHGGRILLATLAALLLVVVAAVTLSPRNSPAAPLADPPGSPRGAGSPTGSSPGGPESPSPVPSPRSPSASPSPSATRPTPTAPATHPPATSSRKGVAVSTFDGVSTALARSGAHWYYTWSTSHGGVTTPPGADFVPMIWGVGSTGNGTIHQVQHSGATELLGFNEPDLASQANMSVAQALDLWPKLMSTGLRLGSPAVASGGATPGGWLDQFMTGAAQKGYRVDFITLHWYGGNFTTADAVSQLRSYVQAVHDRYHKPIWLTEFALIDFSNGTRFPSEAQQAAFLTAATAMLDGLPYLERYAWFILAASENGPSSGLYLPGPEVTPVGRAFEAAR
jgi:hypothetical protein